MKNSTVLGTGICGAAVAAVCCFTPLLVVLLATLGLSAWLGWIDYVLWPAMIGFSGIAVYAVVRRGEERPLAGDDAAAPSGRRQP